MKVRTWKILDWGTVAPDTCSTIPLACGCGMTAQLAVQGRVLSIGGGEGGDVSVVFDRGRHALPQKIQCRTCRRVLVLVHEPSSVRGG